MQTILHRCVGQVEVVKKRSVIEMLGFSNILVRSLTEKYKSSVWEILSQSNEPTLGIYIICM